MNAEIAEILGAFIGDGWIQGDKTAFYITGNLTEDKPYYDNFLAPLFSKSFTPVKPREFPYWGVYGIATCKSKTIKKALDLGFQSGRKALTAKIPNYVIESGNRSILIPILRGLFDTDGCISFDKSRAPTTSNLWKRTHNYIPEIMISSTSKILVEQVQCLLSWLGINSKVRHKNKQGFVCNRNVHDSYQVEIQKKADVIKWFETIGTNNLRHKSKYNVWNAIGYVPPKTTLQQRLTLLKFQDL